MILKFLLQTGSREANHQGVPFSNVKVHSNKEAEI